MPNPEFPLDRQPIHRPIWLSLIAALVFALGFLTLLGGLWLLVLGGSPYYLMAGLLLAADAWLLWRRDPRGLWLFAAILAATLAWAVWEVGLDWWRLVPRGDLLVILGVLLALPWTTRAFNGRWPGHAAPLIAVLALAAIAGVASGTQDRWLREGALPGPRTTVSANYAGVADGDWAAYGRSTLGDKWSPLRQLTPANVSGLEQVWQFHTGDLKRAGDPDEFTYEVTPIKLGDTLYLCSPHNVVFALDAETGKERWRFDPNVRTGRNYQHMTCRGVSWFAAGGTGDCANRIVTTTNDARIIELDARTGRLCSGFGNGGQVDTAPQIPASREGGFQYTSAPLVAGGKIIVAGAIYDNKNVFMPSGAIRAYDARTGQLMWNFDPGNPDQTAPLAPGQHYVPSTPNVWSTASADEALGMVYLPFGMGAIDQWGGQRPPTTERFASSVVALDLATGRLRWVFQTVHHDLWDMDVPAQPALVDLDIPGKGRMPALVQSTKTGNIFVLDRRTGQPLLPVSERPVPTSDPAPGDRLSPTQPFSAASFMPTARVREADMWGATMLDQLTCRIAFRRLRYEGPFTPPSTKGTLVYPGNFGVMDWGGMAIDPERMVAFANPSYMAFVDRLIPQAVARDHDMGGAEAGQHGPSGGSDRKGSAVKGYNPNTGAPFAVALNPFLSLIGLPCQSPPWGYVAGMDLTTGKVVYQRRNGTIRDEAPLPLPFKLGVPSLGGPMVTAGGVAFLGSALDYYLRAYDTASGKVLWRARLPAGGQATPMTYISPASGRQFVIAVAGGHGSLGTRAGDSVIAYALRRPPG